LLWKSGKDDAFSILYDRYVLKLLSIAINKTKDREDAEELVQNCFFKFYERKREIEANTVVFAYLYVVLKNQILNYHRSLLVRQKYERYALANLNEVDNSLIENLESQEFERELANAIDLLPAKCQKVFLLSRECHFTNKEIATTLSISENTVEQHMRKALGRLRSSLKQYLTIWL
jgi:RNA polymerase sigma-70 factor (family 1)